MRFFSLLILLSLTLGSLWTATAQEAVGDDGSVLLRLKYATFDPVAGLPAMPADLRLNPTSYSGEMAYIVQFKGPIEEVWKEQVRTLGGRVMDYVPDYAFLVWMDGSTRDAVAGLEVVRWVGGYQPAYKLSPNLDRSPAVYRVVLFEGADLVAVEARLAGLDTPTAAVSGEQFTLALPDGGIDTVAGWPEVLWIENRPTYRLLNDVAGGIMQAPAAWTNGYQGSGMMVTVADSGIDSGVDNWAVPGDMHPDLDNRVSHISSWPVVGDGLCIANPGADDGASDEDSGHGTHVIGSVGGNGSASAGQIKGLAPQATLTFQALEQWTTYTAICGGSSGYQVTGIPDDISELFQEAYGWGSRIHSNSWGADVYGEYTTDSRTVDQFVWEHPDMLILFSAGNAGTDTNWNGYVDQDSIGSPASAKNSIASGASDNERDTGGYNPGGPCWNWGNCWPSDFPVNPTKEDRLSDTRQELAAFSSRGPTDDGRLKPDLVAPGTNILSTRSQEPTVGTGWGPYLANSYYMYFGGTSMSNPLIAGAAVLVREYYVAGWGHTPSAALVKATLINSAVDITGYGNAAQEAGLPIPNDHEGWGRVDVGAATSGGREVQDGDAVRTGDVRTYTYDVSSFDTPFRATLAWSDYPGALPAGGLVNNLNLVVTAPDGTVYRGNNFSGGWSVAGGTADSVNNVESVYVSNPAVGKWTVRVQGANVAEGGQQPFALVITGALGSPPLLIVNYATGAPGSYFAFTALNFSPHADATISINGTVLSTLQTDGTGMLEFSLDTRNLPAAKYLVMIEANPSAGAAIVLDGSEPLRPLEGSGPVIVVPGTVDPLKTRFLPLITRNHVTESKPVVELENGNFEAGQTSWTEYSAHGWPLIVNTGFPNGVAPHSGSWAVWLGGELDDVSYIEQQVTIQPTQPYLHYWHWIDSADFCGRDLASVRVDGAVVESYDLCLAENTGGWAEHVVDLGAYADQTVTLQIRVETDYNFHSNLYVDDVSLQASAVAQDPEGTKFLEVGTPGPRPSRRDPSVQEE